MVLYGVALYLQVRHIRKGGIKDVIIKRIDGVVVFALFLCLFKCEKENATAIAANILNAKGQTYLPFFRLRVTCE